MSALANSAVLWALRCKRRVDALEALPYHRARFIRQRAAGHVLQFTEYGWLLKCAMRPTLGKLRATEARWPAARSAQ